MTRMHASYPEFPHCHNHRSVLKTVLWTLINIVVVINQVKCQCLDQQIVNAGSEPIDIALSENVTCCNSLCTWHVWVHSGLHTLLETKIFHVTGAYRGCPQDYFEVLFNPTYSDTPGEDLLVSLGRWCGQTYAPKIVVKGNIIIRLRKTHRTDHFKVRVSAIGEAWICNRPEILTVRRQEAYLYSPGYPVEYPSPVVCNWTLVAENLSDVISVETVKFSMENVQGCSYDYLQLHNGTDSVRMCGDDGFLYVSGVSKIWATFQTDSSITRPGFMLKYYSQPAYNSSCLPGKVRVLTALRTASLIHVPVLTLRENICQWRLQAEDPNDVVVLEVLRWDVRVATSVCVFSSQVHDGTDETATKIVKDCAYTQNFRNIRSSGSSLFVILTGHKPATTVKGDGVYLKYSSRSPYDFLETYLTSSAMSYMWIPHIFSNNQDVYGALRLHLSTEYNIHCIVMAQYDNAFGRLIFSSDYIVYDGNSTRSLPLGIGCTDVSPMFLRTTDSNALLQRNPKSSTKLSFWLEYSTSTTCGGNAVQLDADFSPKYISTPIVPLGFPRRGMCLYYIEAPMSKAVNLTVLESRLNGNCDSTKLSVYDAGGKSNLMTEWCDFSRPSMITSGFQMTITYRFNESSISTFHLQYRAKDEVTCGPKYLHASSVHQELVSPGYPGLYPNKMDCQWQLSTYSDADVIKVQLIFINIPGNCKTKQEDYLDLYDGNFRQDDYRLARLCGDGYTENTYRSTGQTLLVTFTSNSSHVGSGFRLVYYSILNPAPKWCEHPEHLTALYGSRQVLNSPNYPDLYPNNLNCIWVIKASMPTSIVVLRVVQSIVEIGNIGEECSADYLVAYDGPTVDPINKLKHWCGLAKPTVRSSGQALTLQFVTNSHYRDKGFVIEYFSESEANNCMDGRIVPLTATLSTKQIQTPNYPMDYPRNMDCAWRIKSLNSTYVVKIEVIHSRIEDSHTCHSDAAQVYDGFDSYTKKLGQWCGDTIPEVFHSSGQFMFLIFHSDHQNQDQGFVLSYQSVYPPLPEPRAQSSGDSVGVIVGATLASLLLVLVAITVLICWLRHTAASRANRRPGNSTSSNRNDRTVFVVSPIYINNHTDLSAAPPPYPGHSNPAYVHSPSDDLPPSYEEYITLSNNQRESAGLSSTTGRTDQQRTVRLGSTPGSSSTDDPPPYSQIDSSLRYPTEPPPNYSETHGSLTVQQQRPLDSTQSAQTGVRRPCITTTV